eukprot:CAMPEP_0197031660 /NCGR_PEP_ID=MMETSP1384-20130603/10600_1 /TAXON_ID=29189 /ORGANISM="Ammonia sp." /LENGTH=485 /DNA_ID=CAMNT_0042461219 /DNA_START=28 /DNA_END=1485 /DNA_ORIENTATION=-
MYGVLNPDDNYPNIANKKSALGKCLTKEIYTRLFWSKTSSGYTLDKAIQIGLDCPEHDIGFFLGDYECIDVFEPLLGPILNTTHPDFDYFDANIVHQGSLKMINFEGTQTLKDFVIEYAFHLRRNLRGYSLPPQCTRAERREINNILIYILKQLQFDASFPNLQYIEAKLMKNKKGNQSQATPTANKHNVLIITDEDDNKTKYGKTGNKTPRSKKKKAPSTDNKASKAKSKGSPASPRATKSGSASPRSTHSDDTKNNDDDDEDENKTRGGKLSASLENLNESSRVVDLVNIDDATLTELEENGLAPSREASLTSEYLIGGLSRDFPDARTLFYNEQAMVGAWTNHENHLEMIIQHTRPDLNYVYKKFVDIYIQFRKILKRKEMAWIRHRRLGIVTTSPKHFGTGLTIQCSIRAPHLSTHAKFARILNKRHLELIATSQDIVNLETIHTLGRSEWQIAQDLGNALIDLCRMEKALARNKPIDQLI